MSPNLIGSLLSRPDRLDVPAVLLLGGPYVMLNGDRREVPDGSKRLLVFVALGTGRVDRRYAAGSLWPLGNDERAAGNLRSALWLWGSRTGPLWLTWAFYAARSYSLRRPPSTGRRLTRTWERSATG